MTCIQPVPRGLGVFLASPDRFPDRASADAHACGARWAACFVEGPKGGRAPVERLDAFHGALQHYGIAPWLWSYPHPDTWRDAIIHLRDVWHRQRWAGVIVDCETAPDGKRWDGGEFLAMLAEAADMQPTPTAWDRRYAPYLPNAGPLLLQVYKRAEHDARVEAEIRWWTARGLDVIPCVGSFLGDAARLRSDLVNVAYDDHGNMRHALAIWSLATTRGAERDVLREFGDRIAGSP